MDAEKLGAVRQLQQRFPALSVSDARALLQSHRWNVAAATAAAEARERAQATAARGDAQTYFVGGAGQGGSAQQVIAAPAPSSAQGSKSQHNDNNNNNESSSSGRDVDVGEVQRLIEQVFAKAAKSAGKADHRDYLASMPSAATAAGEDATRHNDDDGDDTHAHAQPDDDDDDDDGGSATPGHVQAFYGHGRRLGYTHFPSPRMAATLRRTRRVAIAAYRNGFVVDDTLFVPLHSAEGAAFARALQQGHIPALLAERYPDCDITAKLQDCLAHDYTAPAYTAFAGTGHRLSSSSSSSSPASGMTTATAPTTSAAATTTATTATPTLTVNDGDDDVTTLCLVTTAGAKHEVRVNATRHTVDDVYTLASALEASSSSSSSSSLLLVVRDRPPRKLGSETRTQTIEQAKLKRAVVMIQRAAS